MLSLIRAGLSLRPVLAGGPAVASLPAVRESRCGQAARFRTAGGNGLKLAAAR